MTDADTKAALKRAIWTLQGRRRPGVRAGERLAARLNRLIDDRETEERTRSDIIDEMASAAGIDRGTVNQILNGAINCPPLDRLEGFAEVLEVSAASLVEVAEQDGCEFGDGEDEE